MSGASFLGAGQASSVPDWNSWFEALGTEAVVPDAYYPENNHTLVKGRQCRKR
jgi:hypothetical protein